MKKAICTLFAFMMLFGPALHAQDIPAVRNSTRVGMNLARTGVAVGVLAAIIAVVATNHHGSHSHS